MVYPYFVFLVTEPPVLQVTEPPVLQVTEPPVLQVTEPPVLQVTEPPVLQFHAVFLAASTMSVAAYRLPSPAMSATITTITTTITTITTTITTITTTNTITPVTSTTNQLVSLLPPSPPSLLLPPPSLLPSPPPSLLPPPLPSPPTPPSRRTGNSGQKLIIRSFKTSQYLKFSAVKIAKTYNQLPENIVSVVSILDRSIGSLVAHTTNYQNKSLQAHKKSTNCNGLIVEDALCYQSSTHLGDVEWFVTSSLNSEAPRMAAVKHVEEARHSALRCRFMSGAALPDACEQPSHPCTSGCPHPGTNERSHIEADAPRNLNSGNTLAGLQNSGGWKQGSAPDKRRSFRALESAILIVNTLLNRRSN
ncbi:hypothetical protein FHG87_010256 [Trinorchestia longiramus]|nr:hypothetical protein FHG87_010256 [Trinorchestia longiramus]